MRLQQVRPVPAQRLVAVAKRDDLGRDEFRDLARVGATAVFGAEDGVAMGEPLVDEKEQRT